jgi:hypothetical protein
LRHDYTIIQKNLPVNFNKGEKKEKKGASQNFIEFWKILVILVPGKVFAPGVIITVKAVKNRENYGRKLKPASRVPGTRSLPESSNYKLKTKN